MPVLPLQPRTPPTRPNDPAARGHASGARCAAKLWKGVRHFDRRVEGMPSDRNGSRQPGDCVGDARHVGLP
jgi:hypothetical protein